MSFQADKGVILWKMHFASPPEMVYAALATDAGRARYWAESAPEVNGTIAFRIPNFDLFYGRVLRRRKPSLFRLEYFGTLVEFSLRSDKKGGTDLSLKATEVPEAIRMEMVAGWVSVLMAMKAAVDHGVDLRNHDATRAWENGYADN